MGDGCGQNFFNEGAMPGQGSGGPGNMKFSFNMGEQQGVRGSTKIFAAHTNARTDG